MGGVGYAVFVAPELIFRPGTCSVACTHTFVCFPVVSLHSKGGSIAPFLATGTRALRIKALGSCHTSKFEHKKPTPQQ